MPPDAGNIVGSSRPRGPGRYSKNGSIDTAEARRRERSRREQEPGAPSLSLQLPGCRPGLLSGPPCPSGVSHTCPFLPSQRVSGGIDGSERPPDAVQNHQGSLVRARIPGRSSCPPDSVGLVWGQGMSISHQPQAGVGAGRGEGCLLVTALHGVHREHRECRACLYCPSVDGQSDWPTPLPTQEALTCGLTLPPMASISSCSRSNRRWGQGHTD